MSTMVDEIYDRMYREGRAELHAGMERFFGVIGREVGKSLKAIHQFEWSAPWATKAAASSKDVGCA